MRKVESYKAKWFLILIVLLSIVNWSQALKSDRILVRTKIEHLPHINNLMQKNYNYKMAERVFFNGESSLKNLISPTNNNNAVDVVTAVFIPIGNANKENPNLYQSNKLFESMPDILVNKETKIEYANFETYKTRELRSIPKSKKIQVNNQKKIHTNKISGGNVFKKKGKIQQPDQFTSQSSDSSTIAIKDPKFLKQWYLHNTGQIGSDYMMDVNILPVWSKGFDGRGTVIAILDDGLDYNNPDIAPNYDEKASYDFQDNDSDPFPENEHQESGHGTKCASIIAGASNNYCGIGVAYNATIVGIRMLENRTTDSIEASALSHENQYIDIYSCNWGPRDDGMRFGKPGPLAVKALRNGSKKGRKGLGSIYVWSSGNGGENGDDCNADGYITNLHTIAIGAIAYNGEKTHYSEYCSSILATTFSGSSDIENGKEQTIINSDLNGKCNEEFAGTSSSASIASGLIALMIQANPLITWRDVQHIIIESSQIVNPSDSGWVRNAAGKWFNPKYGFGKLEALSLVQTAYQWKNIAAEQIKCKIDRSALLADSKTNEMASSPPVPIYKGSTILLNLDSAYCLDKIYNTDEDNSDSENQPKPKLSSLVNTISKLEHVQVQVSLTHECRGRLELFLISPAGTKSQLLKPRKKDTSSKGLHEWTFKSVHFWGESAVGQWTLVVGDNLKDDPCLIGHLSKTNNLIIENGPKISPNISNAMLNENNQSTQTNKKIDSNSQFTLSNATLSEKAQSPISDSTLNQKIQNYISNTSLPDKNPSASKNLDTLANNSDIMDNISSQKTRDDILPKSENPQGTISLPTVPTVGTVGYSTQQNIGVPGYPTSVSDPLDSSSVIQPIDQKYNLQYLEARKLDSVANQNSKSTSNSIPTGNDNNIQSVRNADKNLNNNIVDINANTDGNSDSKLDKDSIEKLSKQLNKVSKFYDLFDELSELKDATLKNRQMNNAQDNIGSEVPIHSIPNKGNKKKHTKKITSSNIENNNEGDSDEEDDEETGDFQRSHALDRERLVTQTDEDENDDESAQQLGTSKETVATKDIDRELKTGKKLINSILKNKNKEKYRTEKHKKHEKIDGTSTLQPKSTDSRVYERIVMEKVKIDDEPVETKNKKSKTVRSKKNGPIPITTVGRTSKTNMDKLKHSENTITQLDSDYTERREKRNVPLMQDRKNIKKQKILRKNNINSESNQNGHINQNKTDSYSRTNDKEKYIERETIFDNLEKRNQIISLKKTSKLNSDIFEDGNSQSKGMIKDDDDDLFEYSNHSNSLRTDKTNNNTRKYKKISNREHERSSIELTSDTDQAEDDSSDLFVQYSNRKRIKVGAIDSVKLILYGT